MKTNSQPTISRRTVLRGAGALLALPFMESLLPTRAFAASAVKPPLRMGIFTVTGGTVLESWRLPTAGAIDTLPSILRPLEFAKDDLLILDGLSQQGRAEGVNAHEHCAYLHLTGAEHVKKEGGRIHAAVSVDQVVAKKVGEQTYLPSMEMGLGGGENIYSFRSPDAPVPYEANPRLVFERMFRGRKPVCPIGAGGRQQRVRQCARAGRAIRQSRAWWTWCLRNRKTCGNLWEKPTNASSMNMSNRCTRWRSALRVLKRGSASRRSMR